MPPIFGMSFSFAFAESENAKYTGCSDCSNKAIPSEISLSKFSLSVAEETTLVHARQFAGQNEVNWIISEELLLPLSLGRRT